MKDTGHVSWDLLGFTLTPGCVENVKGTVRTRTIKDERGDHDLKCHLSSYFHIQTGGFLLKIITCS